MDIDKAYTLGYSFNSNGLIEAPSQLSTYSTLEQLNALEKLPIANRRQLEINNSGTDITSYLGQLSKDYIINNEFTAEDIKVLDSLIRYISSNNITLVTSDREKELRFVVRAIQRHNNPQLTMSDSEALKNNIVSKIHQIISNPSNQTWANTPVSVSDWHEAIKKVNERRREQLQSGELINTYNWNTQTTPQQTNVQPSGTINVYWGQAESETSTKILSNLAPRRFTFEGREYGSVEHAYQSNKSGTFDQATYDAYLKGNNLTTFTNHSGGAIGADTQWDIIGKEFGMVNNKHYYFEGFKTPKGNTPISINLKNEADEKLKAANKTLGRKFPTSKEYVNNLLRRNWWQVKNSDAVFAISSITDNKVDGGTGWAVHMAIAENKPVYVFDQKTNKWFTWNTNKFVETLTPTLTKNFAGIGTREINEAGKQAIRDVYNNSKTGINNAYGKKIRGKGTVAEMRAANNLELMKRLVVESFKQNPNSEAAKKLMQYENFTHNTNTVIDKAFLEGLKLAQTELLQSNSVGEIISETSLFGQESTSIQNPTDIPNILNSNPTVLNEDTGYYVHEWGEVEAGEYTNYERQSTFKTRVLYPGIAETTSPIMEKAAKFGDFIDEIGRNVFEGNISSDNLKLINTIFSNWEKSQNITRFKDKETLQIIVKSVVSQMEQVRNDLIKKGYKFETKGVKVWGKFSQKGRENFNRDSKQDDKEHTLGIAGTLDIVAYDKSGNIIIIDFKSFKSNSIYGLDYALSNLLDSKGKYKSRVSGYAEQQEIYKLLLENEYNVKVEDIYAFVIPYSMTADGTVIANHSLNDLAKAYKNSKNPIKLPISNKHSSGLLNLKGYAGEKYKSASGATGRDAFLNTIKSNLELKGRDRSASKIIKDSQKRVNSNKKNLLSSYDMFSYYQQQYNASVGKDDVGIAANGIKVFYALSNYFNNYYKQGDFDTNILTNRKMFNKTLEFVKNGIPTNYSGTYTTIADVQIPNQSLNNLQAINSNFMQRFVDAANNLSSFLSAATDNAKELIMAQVNASTDLAAMHIYLMILGLNIEQVVEIMTDPIMTSIVKSMETNIFTNDKVQTFLQITKNLKKEYSANKDWDNVKNIEAYEAIFRGGQEITSLSSLLGVNQKRTADTWELYDYLDKFRNLITTTENKFYTFSKFDKTGLNHINENNYQKILTIVANKISIDKGYTTLNPDGTVIGDPEIVEEILGTLYRAYRLDIMNGNFDFEKYFSDSEYKEVSKDYYNLIKETFNVLDVVDEVAHFQSMIGSLDLFHNMLKKYVAKYKYVFNEFREVNKNTYSTDKKLTRGISYFDTKAREHWFKSGDMLNFAFKVKDLMRLAGVDKFLMYTSSQAKNNNIKDEHTLEVELKDSSDPIIDLQTNEGIANFKRAFEQLMFPVIQQGLGKDNFLKLDKIISQFGVKMVAVTPNVNLSNSKVPMLLKKFQETLRTFDNLDAKMGIEYQVKNSIQEYVKWKDILFVYNLIVNNERYGNKRLTPLFENYSKDKSTLGYNYSKFWSQIDEGTINILDGTTLEDIAFFSENIKGIYVEKGIYGDNTDFVMITNTTESETDKVYNKDIADVLKMLKEGGFIITLKC